MKTNVSKIVRSFKKAASKHSPEILTGIGIAGMITTTVIAVKATPKALDLIARAEEEKFDNGHGGKLKPVEVVKAAWKPYIPAVISGTVSIACLVGANSVNAKRNAALATAYKLSETALLEYKDKVVETIGEKKEKQIREKVAQKKVDDNPLSTSEVVLIGNGQVLFLEPISMRYFKSDIETVRSKINDINERLTTGMEEYISLSQFYDEIGLSHTATSDDLGWNLGRDGQLKVEFPVTKTDKGEPCLMIDYHVSPRYEYYKLI